MVITRWSRIKVEGLIISARGLSLTFLLHYFVFLSGTLYILDSLFNFLIQYIASYLALAPWVLNMHNAYPSYVRWVCRVVELGAIPQNCGL